MKFKHHLSLYFEIPAVPVAKIKITRCNNNNNNNIILDFVMEKDVCMYLITSMYLYTYTTQNTNTNTIKFI